MTTSSIVKTLKGILSDKEGYISGTVLAIDANGRVSVSTRNGVLFGYYPLLNSIKPGDSVVIKDSFIQINTKSKEPTVYSV